MATTNGIAVKKQNLAPASEANTLKGLLDTESVKKRFEEILGKKAPGFISSIIAVANDNKLLAKANPQTVLSAAAQAATLDLPINKNLGFAYIVPYGNEAQFQLGYKGYIQLAMRSGQYQTINATEVYEGEIKNVNRFTGSFEFGERESDKVVGYMAYFKLINGFEKYLYMTLEEMQTHAKKYSKGYRGGTEKWGLADFDSMATKTVLKRLISKYGILSLEMQGSEQMAVALATDGAVIRDDGQTLTADFDGETIEAETVAVDTGETIDVKTGEMVNEAPTSDELI